MRLWSLHPENLDKAGLGAAWREALLAQAVINTDRGYSKHAQLKRFNANPGALSSLLRCICDEARRRGYNYDASKIKLGEGSISVTRGQVEYERKFLQAKLDARKAGRIATSTVASCFYVVDGDIECWEVIHNGRV